MEGLLLLARADAGVLRMDLKPMNPAQVIQEVYEQGRSLAHARDISLKLGDLTPATVKGDREQLRRLLLNLVDNAVKYTDAGGQVTISLHQDQQWVSLQVADTGIGIPQDEKEQVLQPFYRSDHATAQSDRGVGLGLSIVKSIAEAHGGKIEVDSTPGRGSTFRVLLPVYRELS